MPYKDKEQRYAAIRRSVAKKPEHYRLLSLHNKRKACRRGYHIQRRYGITLETYNTMLEAQKHACALCGKMPKPTKSGWCGLHVDHCHITSKVRGLLCARCNTFVGYADKQGFEELLQKVKDYLHAD